MPYQMWVTFFILIFTTVLFVWGRWRADLVAVASLLCLLLAGIIDVKEALAGFSDSVVIMIAALFIVGGGIFRTGLAKMMGNSLLRLAGNNEAQLLTVIMVTVAIFSGFMSNTGTVAVLLPVIVSLSVNLNIHPSRFLIPLSFASSLGGVLTLIGTPPNLVVSQVLVKYGLEPFSFFDFTPMGIVILVCGLLFMVFIGRSLLPQTTIADYQQKRTGFPDSLNLANLYQLSDQVYPIRVGRDSNIVGKRLLELKFPATFGIYVLHIERKGKHILAGPETMIAENDILFVQGARIDMQKLINHYGLFLLSDRMSKSEKVFNRKGIGIVEVLLTPHSSLLNQTILDTRFRERFKVHVLGLNRRGEMLLKDFTKEKLKFGDALLVEGSWEDIELLAQEAKDVVVVGQPKEEASKAATNGKAPVAALIMVAMLVTMTLEILPAVTTILVAAFLMVLTGCLRNLEEAYSSINWESVVLIAAMLPMATALEKTGGVTFISERLVQNLGVYGPIAVLAGIYFLTNIFSQFISNTATAVLFAPIAITAATNMGVSPYPLLMTVSIAASMAFATPVASPTNALVMTAGGYKFIDFVKVGLPLQVMIGIITLIVLPLLFPF
ncbi:SLC13 family permease [Ammoniphilus sp. CFH 90114]|uniref:SLC13 family permease n=1 Tax=Ammoniphilus sp. CFH 90114 TaxID=2493665 RepID=UPI00100EDB6E|nr:SLC13 family permease [Ammoniphilus sp. CFH 90114]RXT08019.1 SLC13 family permease [Ammoniphilus sp. CFH 90114]